MVLAAAGLDAGAAQEREPEFVRLSGYVRSAVNDEVLRSARLEIPGPQSAIRSLLRARLLEEIRNDQASLYQLAPHGMDLATNASPPIGALILGVKKLLTPRFKE